MTRAVVVVVAAVDLLHMKPARSQAPVVGAEALGEATAAGVPSGGAGGKIKTSSRCRWLKAGSTLRLQ